MKPNVYPLTFAPVFQDYIWGGRNLKTILGRDIPPGIVAESWDISGHEAGPTTVDRGPLSGLTLPQVMARLGTDLVGRRSIDMLKRGKFPLLVKILDANQPLSVQVHPSDAYANIHEQGELGKTEMWYILYAKPGARLIYGLKPNVTPQLFREHLEAGNLEPCLHELAVRPGDAIFIPSGSIHAILDGILLAEIQQNSNTTYRVYDWNRLGADGKPRQLHIDKAIEVIDFAQVEPGVYRPEPIEFTSHYKRELISDCAYFNVERFTFSEDGGSFRGDCNGDTFEIWGTMQGHSQVHWADNTLDLPAVRFSLIPAVLGSFEISAGRPSTLLRIYVPG